MMNRTQHVQAIVWLDQLAAKAKVESAKLREQLSADARAELEEQGTAPTWRIPDVATVSASVSRETVYVASDRQLTDWVARRYPTEVETVTAIRAAWLADFLGRCQPSGDVVCDPDGGEVVPGLAVRPGGAFGGLSIRVSSAAKEVFGALAQAGLEKLAIEAGPIAPAVLDGVS